MRYVGYIFIFVILSFPALMSANGLVPCGDPGQPACEVCHVVQLFDNVLDWLLGILSLVVTIVIVVSGVQMVTSVGNTSLQVEARKRITTALLGFVIILSAWLIVDLVMKTVLNPGSDVDLGFWNSLQCSA